MNQELFEKYLTDRYYSQMDYYKAASAKNQSYYRKFQWMLIVLSALTPVLAAINGFNTKDSLAPEFTLILKILLLIVSSAVAILTTGLKTFNYHELWVKYRTTYEKLKPEIFYYQSNSGPYNVADVDKFSLFITRVEVILDTEHLQWPPSKNPETK